MSWQGQQRLRLIEQRLDACHRNSGLAQCGGAHGQRERCAGTVFGELWCKTRTNQQIRDERSDAGDMALAVRGKCRIVRREFGHRVDEKAAAKYPTVTSKVDVPEIANHTPHLKMTWDQAKIKISPLEVKKILLETEPSIEVTPSTSKEELVVTVWMLKPGEAEVVARRIGEVLKAAVA